MWAYFLIIIATDKVINFKTTLFFSWSKWHYIEINSECREAGAWHSGDCSAGDSPFILPFAARPTEMGVAINWLRLLYQKEQGRKHDQV